LSPNLLVRQSSLKSNSALPVDVLTKQLYSIEVTLVMANPFARLLLIGVLPVLASCYAQPNQFAAKDYQRDGMSIVITSVTIDGSPEAVFDLVTTARFWPQWHPATRAVGGVTERPFQVGDRIHEAGRIGNLDFQTSWKVVEHVRPSRTFSMGGGGTVFTRELTYKLENFAAVAATSGAAEALMQSQSDQAVKQLKEMVEKILREEAAGIR
jgi:uncharacterized protein YndB with AHSA1/START domain